ncbi:MAG: hypothetical protein BWY56_02589 [Acidobacteria bacterium ADurb.Bin340]|nr:MAG: hypothetical protein BWY56_02589 [Acidobacteria bacterium ADurb.Bin340]
MVDDHQPQAAPIGASRPGPGLDLGADRTGNLIQAQETELPAQSLGHPLDEVVLLGEHQEERILVHPEPRRGPLQRSPPDRSSATALDHRVPIPLGLGLLLVIQPGAVPPQQGMVRLLREAQPHLLLIEVGHLRGSHQTQVPLQRQIQGGFLSHPEEIADALAGIPQGQFHAFPAQALHHALQQGAAGIREGAGHVRIWGEIHQPVKIRAAQRAWQPQKETGQVLGGPVAFAGRHGFVGEPPILQVQAHLFARLELPGFEFAAPHGQRQPLGLQVDQGERLAVLAVGHRHLFVGRQQAVEEGLDGQGIFHQARIAHGRPRRDPPGSHRPSASRRASRVTGLGR